MQASPSACSTAFGPEGPTCVTVFRSEIRTLVDLECLFRALNCRAPSLSTAVRCGGNLARSEHFLGSNNMTPGRIRAPFSKRKMTNLWVHIDGTTVSFQNWIRGSGLRKESLTRSNATCNAHKFTCEERYFIAFN